MDKKKLLTHRIWSVICFVFFSLAAYFCMNFYLSMSMPGYVYSEEKNVMSVIDMLYMATIIAAAVMSLFATIALFSSKQEDKTYKAVSILYIFAGVFGILTFLGTLIFLLLIVMALANGTYMALMTMPIWMIAAIIISFIIASNVKKGMSDSKAHAGKIFIIGFIVAVAAGILFVIGTTVAETINYEKSTKELMEGFSTDMLAMETFDGEVLTQEEISKYDVVILNIWATTCTPCKNEMPCIEEALQEVDTDKVLFISVCADVVDEDGNITEETMTEARNIVETSGVTYLNCIPGKDLYQNVLMNVSAFPTNLVVNKDGVVVERDEGGMDKEGWIAYINKFIGGELF